MIASLEKVKRKIQTMTNEVSGLAGLAVGRTVHYVLPDGPSKGDHRPATIVRIFESMKATGTINLQVFTDGLNDGFKTAFAVMNGKEQVGVTTQTDLIVWRTSVHYDENKAPGTWHWPERV